MGAPQCAGVSGLVAERRSAGTEVDSILAILELADGEDLHRYLVERVGALVGVQRDQTEIVARWIKRAGPSVPRT